MSTRGWTKKAVVGLASVLLGGASLIVVEVGGGGVSTGASSPLLVMNSETFPDTTLGTYSPSANPSVLSNSGPTDTIDLNTDVSFSGPGADDYIITPGNCSGDGVSTIVLQSGQSCTPVINFYPGALGNRSATMTIQGSADTSPVSVPLSGTGTIGYYEVDSYGDVATAGDASYFGDTGSVNLNHPIVGMAATGRRGLLAGGLRRRASSPSATPRSTARPAPSTSTSRSWAWPPRPTAEGYWLVASDGGIFSFGDATFYGSTGAMHLNKPIVGMAATPDGGGYWLVASDGGIFAFGDAQLLRLDRRHPPEPARSWAWPPTPDGGGYWLVASDGGIFAFGDAPFYGSTGAIHLNQPIVAMAPMPTVTDTGSPPQTGVCSTSGTRPSMAAESGTVWVRWWIWPPTANQPYRLKRISPPSERIFRIWALALYGECRYLPGPD